MRNLKDVASSFIDMGIPVGPAEQKRILVPNWSKLTADQFLEKQYNSFWDKATGIGMLCGEASGVIGLDIDLILSNCDTALLESIVSKLPPIYSGKAGHPDKRPTQFFRYNGESGRKFNNIHVEILSDGNQTIMPPSRHPNFDKEYEWVGKPLYEIDIDDLPYLPEGFIEYLEQLNDGLKPAKSEVDKTKIKIEGRCNSGSHLKLSAIAVALFHDKYPFDRLVKRMISEDKKFNNDADFYYFECPSRPWRHKGDGCVEKNAGDFIEEIFKKYGPGGSKVAAEFTAIKPDEFETVVPNEIPKPVNKNEIVLLPLKDLLERPDELTQYLVDGLLPAGGTSIVAAKPKCGKTTLLRQLSLCVARGEMFLNRVCSKGPVIYFSVEEKIDEIKAHFKAMGANGSEEIYIFANRAPQDTIGKLKPIIEKIKPSLIILDTLFKIVRMKDANDYAAISTALEPIQDLARQSGSHVLCVHHAGKSDRDGADGILGSTAILGAFDTAIIMNRNNEKRTIKSIQRYGTDLEESALLFDLPTRRSSLGQENWKVKSDERADLILSFIRQAGQKVTVQEIKMATGMDKEVLLRTLKNMSNQKLVYSFGKGIKGDPLTFSSSI